MAIKVDLSKLFLNSVKNFNVKDEKQSAPLNESAECENFKCLKLLFDAGAEVNSRDEFAQNPLFSAHESENNDIYRIIVEAGAGVLVIDDSQLDHWLTMYPWQMKIVQNCQLMK